jgi:hypothetical protein
VRRSVALRRRTGQSIGGALQKFPGFLYVACRYVRSKMAELDLQAIFFKKAMIK